MILILVGVIVYLSKSWDPVWLELVPAPQLIPQKRQKNGTSTSSHGSKWSILILMGFNWTAKLMQFNVYYIYVYYIYVYYIPSSKNTVATTVLSPDLQLELDTRHVELRLCDEEIVPNVWPVWEEATSSDRVPSLGLNYCPFVSKAWHGMLHYNRTWYNWKGSLSLQQSNVDFSKQLQCLRPAFSWKVAWNLKSFSS